VCEDGRCKNSALGASCIQDVHCTEGDCAPDKCKCAEYVCVLKEAAPAEAAPTKIKLEAPITETSVPRIIGNIIKAILAVVGALALGMFVYGGFTWLTSGGNPDRIKKGRDILLWAFIGLTIVFASYTLVDFILKAFGL
jgi:hypothetical protein